MPASGDRKTIFITGAGSGIGRATAQLFASRGWFVGLTDVDAKGLAGTQGLIPADRQCAHVFDVRDKEGWRAAIGQFGDQTGGRMHALFNNAGIAKGGWFEDIDEADSDRIIDVNVKGVVNGCHAALPLLKATTGARIVNVASAAGIYGAPRLAVYSATKFAVRGLSEALDLEFARHGVRVTCLMPWFVDTPIIDALNERGSNQTMRERIAETKSPLYPVTLAAERTWEAVHGDGVHFTVGKAARDTHLIARLFPNFLRRRMAAQLQSEP